MRATSDGAVAGAIEMSALLYSRWGIDWWCRWREAQGREGGFRNEGRAQACEGLARAATVRGVTAARWLQHEDACETVDGYNLEPR